MKTIISILAYFWAGCCTIVLLSVFINMEYYQGWLMKFPFMKVDPIYTGGNIHQKIEKNGYMLNVHEPVFSALVGESKKGFIQVDVVASSEVVVRDTVDYNLDKIPDFYLSLENDTFKVQSLNGKRYDADRFSRVHNGWIMRVGLDNPMK